MHAASMSMFMYMYMYVYINWYVNVVNCYACFGHTCVTHSSCNLWHVTDLLVVDLPSSLAYFMMTHPLSVAGK